MSQGSQLVSECARLWAPPPKQKLSEWAEQNFILSSEYSAHSGPLRLYEFQREILDSFTDPYVRQIVAMTATQMIKTLLQQVAIAYVIARAPGPILAAQPTETDAETFSKERLSPMIRDMACLRDRVAPEKKTSKANTTLHKVFPGGSLSLIGAQTAGNFARRSIRYFFADERDKWKENVGKEGDGFSLGVKRTATFRSLAKIIQTCSPTIKGNSQIAIAYEGSDQRKFWMPCPECGELQILRWDRVKFDTANPLGTAAYECERCDRKISDVARWDRCELGVWRPSVRFTGTAGFWISELYSPWKKLGELAVDFLEKKDNPVTLQTFVNTSLAETWEAPGEAPPDWEVLMSRVEKSYRLGEVPPEVLLLTAGVDVQKSWLEGYVWGWGRNRERWLIDHWRYDCDPHGEAAWEWLTECLNSTYRTQTGAEMGIAKLALDTGYQESSSAADATQEAYRFARQHGANRVLAIKGVDHGELVGYPTMVDITIRGRKIPNGCKLWPVNVSRCKSELYGLLNRERPAKDEILAGTVHFPCDADEEFFRQLTAERFVLGKGGKGRWEKDGGTRNEALDCHNYTRAAASVEGFDRAADEDWDYLASRVGAPAPRPRAAVEAPAASPAPVRQPPPQRVQQSDFMRGFL